MKKLVVVPAFGSWSLLAILALAGCGSPLDFGTGENPFNPICLVAGDAGCPVPGDAGSDDAGPGQDPDPDPSPDPDPEPEPDGGAAGGVLDEECNAASAPCASAFYCLAPAYRGLPDVEPSRCARRCGTLEAGQLVETPEVCGEFQACNTLLDETLSVTLAAVCRPLEYSRDRACYAFEDPDVCALDRECLVTEVSINAENILVADALRCKDTCTFGDPLADEGCFFNAQCLPDPLAVVINEAQLQNANDQASTIACDPESCDGNGAGCACDLENGYRCADVGATPTCGRLRGICGEVAPYPAAGEVIGLDDLCNETNGSRYCDRRDFLDLEENPALPQCIPLMTPPVDGDGICIGFCSRPAYDYDGNGVIDQLGDEGALALNCPAGLECELGVARSIGLINPGPVEVPCSPALCPAGDPCAQCPSAVECVDAPYLLQPICAAVLGTCQPPINPPLDGGIADAGPVDASAFDGGALDGGALDGGDGPIDTDGGPPLGDAGPGQAGDAGAIDGGPDAG